MPRNRRPVPRHQASLRHTVNTCYSLVGPGIWHQHCLRLSPWRKRHTGGREGRRVASALQELRPCNAARKPATRRAGIAALRRIRSADSHRTHHGDGPCLSCPCYSGRGAKHGKAHCDVGFFISWNQPHVGRALRPVLRLVRQHPAHSAAGLPCRRDSAGSVDVQVRHALSSGLAVVDTDVVAVRMMIFFHDILGLRQRLQQCGLLGCSGVEQRGEVTARNDDGVTERDGKTIPITTVSSSRRGCDWGRDDKKGRVC